MSVRVEPLLYGAETRISPDAWSTSWQLMPWLLAPPCHQKDHCLPKDTFSCSTKQFIASVVKYKCLYSVPKLYEFIWYISMGDDEVLVYGLTTQSREEAQGIHFAVNSCTCHRALSLRENGPAITQKPMGVDPLILSQQSLFNGCHAIYIYVYCVIWSMWHCI